ncbi:hypothetical protein [Halodesulfovibrio aestuarii]|uniref:DUF3796 domain-containing protein n=1 Tax=Halodesulfovibrio aestuarii TaxID=126333 RepID=A0ABV4JY67_9BACT
MIKKIAIIASATLGVFYPYLLMFIFSLSNICFPMYYNLFHGRYKPQAKDYTGDLITMWFYLFAPLSILLASCTIYLIKKYLPNHHSKIFFLFSVIGIGMTFYIAVKLVT